MREIEFRAKDFTGEWRYGYIAKYRNYKNEVYTAILPICDNETQETSIEDITPVNSNTIGQYTGLKDKNGTKIFEGDIVKDILGNIAVIVYKEKYSAFVADKWETGYALWFDKNIEVIGNVIDNPELLGE